MPGVYEGGIHTTASGTERDRITYVSDVRWAAKIVTHGGDDAAWRNDGDYVDIRGFDMSGDTRLGIFQHGSHTRTIGNNVHHINAAGCGDGIGGGGIVNYRRAEENDTIGNYVHDVGRDCAKSLVHGIYHQGRGGRIWNNLVFNNGGWGIRLGHCAYAVVVANNTLWENRSGAIVVGNEPSCAPVNDYTVVLNNIIYRNPRGIFEDKSTGPHVEFSHNLVFGNRIDYRLQNGVTPKASIAADPQFVVFSGDDKGDYRLRESSPAIGAGTAANAPPDDVEGRRRPILPGRKIDIGAYQNR